MKLLEQKNTSKHEQLPAITKLPAVLEDENKSYYTAPNGAVLGQIKKTTNHATKGGKGKTKQKSIRETLEASNTSNSEHIRVYDLGLTGEGIRIVREKGASTTEIQIDNIDAVAPLSKTGEHIFNLVLAETAKQSMNNGFLYKNEINIPLEEIVNKGICTSIESARLCCRSFYKAIETIKVSYRTTEGKGKKQRTLKTKEEGAGVLYYAFKIRDNIFSIYANDQLNWAPITEFYTIAPNYMYKLNYLPAKLLDYITRMNRTHYAEIKSNGFYNLSIDAVIKQLGLINAVKSKDPKAKFRKPLVDALNEINEMDLKEAGLNGNGKDIENYRHYQLYLCNEAGEDMTEADPNTVFTAGYIKIVVKGETLKYCINRQEKQTQRTVERQKKAEARQERIEAKIASKHMANNKEAGTI